MRDYIQEFKKQKFRKNTAIIVSSFAFAFMVNSFLFWTNIGNQLQADIKWATTEKTDKVINSDLYLVKQWTGSDTVSLKTWTSMKQVSELSASIVFNSDESAFKINNILNDTDKNIEVVKISNTPWMYSLILRFKKSTDLPKDYLLANIFYTKYTQEKAQISLIQTKFVSNKETFELTNSPISF